MRSHPQPATDDLFLTRELHPPKALGWLASAASTNAIQPGRHDQIEVMYDQNQPTFDPVPVRSCGGLSRPQDRRTRRQRSQLRALGLKGLGLGQRCIGVESFAQEALAVSRG